MMAACYDPLADGCCELRRMPDGLDCHRFLRALAPAVDAIKGSLLLQVVVKGADSTLHAPIIHYSLAAITGTYLRLTAPARSSVVGTDVGHSARR